MGTKLEGLRYRRIDLVDKGANRAALVMLCKRADNTEEDGMVENAKEPTVEEMQAQLKVATLERQVAEEVAKRASVELELAKTKTLPATPALQSATEPGTTWAKQIHKLKRGHATTLAEIHVVCHLMLSCHAARPSLNPVKFANDDIAGVELADLVERAAAV